MISRLQHKIEHLTNIKNNYYVYVKNVRDINDYMNDILSNNINKSRETNNKLKLKISRVIARYVVQNYRKESISFEKTIKIENHFITRFSTHIRQQILEKHRCFKCLKKEHRFIEDVAFCKHKSIINKKVTIIKLTTMNIA